MLEPDYQIQAVANAADQLFRPQIIATSMLCEFWRFTVTTTSTKSTKVTATELARQLSDILNRIEYRGERFVIERNGKVIATLEPSPSPKQMTMEDFFEFLKHLPRPDPEFADDLEEVLAY